MGNLVIRMSIVRQIRGGGGRGEGSEHEGGSKLPEEKTIVGRGDISSQEISKTAFGPWMVAQKTRRRPSRNNKGNFGGARDQIGVSGRNQGVHSKKMDSKKAKMARSSMRISLGAKS